jgi:hypothetical protein
MDIPPQSIAIERSLMLYTLSSALIFFAPHSQPVVQTQEVLTLLGANLIRARMDIYREEIFGLIAPAVLTLPIRVNILYGINHYPDSAYTGMVCRVEPPYT